MTKPEIVTREQLTDPSAEQSSGMQRGQAFAHDSVWCGYECAGDSLSCWASQPLKPGADCVAMTPSIPARVKFK